jgi:hypothetical protein
LTDLDNIWQSPCQVLSVGFAGLRVFAKALDGAAARSFHSPERRPRRSTHRVQIRLEYQVTIASAMFAGWNALRMKSSTSSGAPRAIGSAVISYP